MGAEDVLLTDIQKENLPIVGKREQQGKVRTIKRITADTQKKKKKSKVNSSSGRISICTVGYFTPHRSVATHVAFTSMHQNRKKKNSKIL